MQLWAQEHGEPPWCCAMARAGHETHIWGRNLQVLSEIREKQRNCAYLKQIPLVSGLQTSENLTRVIKNAHVILLATPAQSISTLLTELTGIIQANQCVIACAKGIDRKSGKTPAELIGNLAQPELIGALSGPSFASDVANGLPTALTLAFDQMSTAKRISGLLSSDNFRIYASNDVIGVELGGAS